MELAAMKPSMLAAMKSPMIEVPTVGNKPVVVEVDVVMVKVGIPVVESPTEAAEEADPKA
jgi:hypothetical protein